uniref:WT1 interacting protein n=1 Tax=Salvator merianae TaxID=96440 RepID=A0A8D0B2A3_SALMN
MERGSEEGLAQTGKLLAELALSADGLGRRRRREPSEAEARTTKQPNGVPCAALLGPPPPYPSGDAAPGPLLRPLNGGEEGLASAARSEVALPCYKRAASCCSSAEGFPRAPTCCAGLASPRGSLTEAPPPPLLSPRSSYASTAGSDTSKHSSPRASLAGSSDGSKASSNRTSGISMGYDQRHASPRSSSSGPAELEMAMAAAAAGGGARHGPAALGPGGGAAAMLLGSPRSSISSHSSRSSRSSRGSMGAYPELQLPSPRASAMLPEESPAAAGPDGAPFARLHPGPPDPAPGPAASSSSSCCSSQPTTLPYAPGGGGGKFCLPFQVTPSRESGPSQVERRLEALALELEKELELHRKKEYFGICVKCGKGVYGASQACQAMGKLYHTNCFTCCSCGRRLRGKAFYNVNGKVYCEEDFLYSGFQQTADKCFICGHLIMEMILQALGKSYHPGCFRCVVCNECLDGVPFTVDVENNIYCVKDYHTVFAPKCASCNQPILPAQGSEETIRVVSMDRDYHVECYHCEDCGLQLNDEEGRRCYPLEGHLLCHSCHMRRLGMKVPSHPPPGYPMHITEL